VTLHLTFTHQRVPMLDASTLEDRTRPALDGSAEARLRYLSSPPWNAEAWARRLYITPELTLPRVGIRPVPAAGRRH